jgi:hypothetical protein
MHLRTHAMHPLDAIRAIDALRLPGVPRERTRRRSPRNP